MNNEPVAWVREDDLKKIRHRHPSISRDKILVDDIPLYTHPVKELTDEEIEELIWNTTDMKDFARAILRKAQEK